MRFRLLPLCLILAPLPLLRADDPKPAGPTIVDGAGKEVALKTWAITAGTRKLTWLAKDGAAAPEALAFRDVNSTLYVEGVMTLIPLDRLESLTYDTTKQTVTAKVAGVEKPLEGSIRYKEINQIAIEADADRGAAGVVALKYRGGVLKGGIQAVRFPGAKAGPAPTGDKTFVTVADKGATHTEAVYQLQALYKQADGKEVLSPAVMFKKTFKIELAQIVSMKIHDDPKAKEVECDVTLKDGSEQTLTLLNTMPIDGKDATLEGFLAAVPVGYKLYPVRCVSEIGKDEPKKEEPKKEAPKKEDPKKVAPKKDQPKKDDGN